MPLESQLFTSKIEKKILTLVFDENDDIIDGIKKACSEVDAKEFKIVGGTGTIKSGRLNYYSNGLLKWRDFSNGKLSNVSGYFRKSKIGYGGDLKTSLTFGGTNLFSGSLLKGFATNEFSVKLSFFQESN